MVADIVAAAEGTRRHRARGRAALDDVFRAGEPPTPPPDGRYAGRLVLLSIAPGLTQLAEAIASAWMPWKGKIFAAQAQTGDNIFTRDSLILARLCWPFYRRVKVDGAKTYRAFAFRTWVGPGLWDPDRDVLKIDYDLDGNPGLMVRRVLDEVVEVGEGVLLGKAHFKWGWGAWQTVAYFMLQAERE